MKIESISVQGYRLPPSTPWEDATNKVQALEFVIVEMTADTGDVGVGVTYSVDIGGAAMVTLIETYLAPLVIGEDPHAYERIWGNLQRQSRRLGEGMANMCIGALDIAIWDLRCKDLDMPLHRLVGGARESVPAYASEINLAADDTPDALVERMRAMVERGFKSVKIKIGREDLAEDVERIRRVKEILPAGGQLFVDLNQKWSAAQALQLAPLLDELNLGWLEEPMLCTDVNAHQQLRRAIRTPVALGESLYSKGQVLNYLRRDAVDIVQADVAFVGGITEWLKIAHLAEAFGRPIAPHYMMEISLPLLCGVRNAFMLEDVAGGGFTELGLLEVPIRTQNGVGTPSQTPGHGIVFDKSALARHQVDARTTAAQFTGGSK